MSCQEVAFARGTCRIEIESGTNGIGVPAFIAHVSLRDKGDEMRLLVADDGSPLEISAESEALALSTAITYLESRFGAISEYPHGCVDPTGSGEPLIIDRVS